MRGPVAVGDLGPTLAHEHVFVLQSEALQNYGHLWGDSYWDEEPRVADAIEKLRALRAAGIQTVVDPTAPGLGRDVRRIQRINAEVDLNIVVASGVYAFLELPNFLAYRSVEAIAAIFVRELTAGIDDTGIRAAFLKCAVEQHGKFVEVYVATSLEECERRDPKGLYAKAHAGEIVEFTGVSDPYEEPSNPELRLQTEGRTPEESAAAVLAKLEELGLLGVRA